MQRSSTNSPHRTWPIQIGMATLALVLALGGCETTQQSAPFAREQLDAGQYSAEQLNAFDVGRDIYLRRCSTCHSIEPINRYSIDKWQSILPGMSDEAGLSEGETRQLADYILTLRIAMHPESPGE